MAGTEEEEGPGPCSGPRCGDLSKFPLWFNAAEFPHLGGKILNIGICGTPSERTKPKLYT